MRILFVLLVAAGVLACSEASGPPEEALEFPPMPDGSVRAAVVAEPIAEGVMAMRILIEAKSQELGAYQGRFRFDPEALELEEVSVPETAYRFVNVEAAAEGELRFAGFTVRGFETPVVLELRFRNKRPVGPEDVSVELEVVGTVGGAEIPRTRFLPPAKLF